MSLERTESKQVNLLTYLSDFVFNFKLDTNEGYVLMFVEDNEDPWYVTPTQLADFAEDLKTVAREACDFGFS
jgi:hypothetical protein